MHICGILFGSCFLVILHMLVGYEMTVCNSFLSLVLHALLAIYLLACVVVVSISFMHERRARAFGQRGAKK